MGRKPMNGQTMRVRTCRFSAECDALLDSMPDASKFIREAVEERLAISDDTILQAEIEHEKKRLRELEDIAMGHKKRIDMMESRLQKHVLKRQGSHELRIKWLTVMSKFGERELDNWLSSRVDVLADCGFKDKEEALTWVRENKQAKTKD